MYKISLYIMVILYLAAGINHFVHPGMYRRIVPAFLPLKNELVVISGFCEILFAILLLPVATRVFAAWAIIILLIAIFPANIQMMLNYHRRSDSRLWLTVVRLPLQFVLIWWAYSFTLLPGK